MFKLKIPNSDKAGLYVLKHLIPKCPDNKLYGIIGMLEKDPDKGPENQQIKEMTIKEIKKRGLTPPI